MHKVVYGLYNGREYLHLEDGRQFTTSNLDFAEAVRSRLIDAGQRNIEIRPLPIQTGGA